MSGQVAFILGGARSGKSAQAERLAASSGRSVLYVATATADDEEMAARIAAHRAQRPASWRTIEAPEALLATIREHASAGDVVLVDCLTLWVSNVLLRLCGPSFEIDGIPAETWSRTEAALMAEALDVIAEARRRNLVLLLVSNEVGMGVVPPYPLGRHFQDILGRVNQAVAATADTVLLMIAGLPVDLRKLAP